MSAAQLPENTEALLVGLRLAEKISTVLLVMMAAPGNSLDGLIHIATGRLWSLKQRG